MKKSSPPSSNFAMLQSFEQFTKQSKRVICRACKLPEEVLSTVNTLLEEGQSRPAIFRWLESQGYPGVTQMVLISHANNHIRKEAK